MISQNKGLVSNYGEGWGVGVGATKREGGLTCEVLPLGKGGGAEKVVAMPKGEHKMFRTHDLPIL